MKQNYNISNMKSSQKSKKNIQLIWMLFVCSFFSIAMEAQTISYSFANAMITNDGSNSYYEVDIMFTTDTDFQLGSGQFYLNFNTAAFGDNIKASNTVTFSHPAAPAAGDPEYILDGDAFDAISLYTVVVNDNTTSRCSFAYVQAQNGSFFPTVTAAGSPHKLAHVKIQYVDASQPANIAFESGDNFDDQTFTAGTTPITPDAVQITDDSFDSSNSTPCIMFDGSTNSDWDDPSNWGANMVPSSTTDVMIPAGLSVSASGNINVRDLDISEGASLTVNSNVNTTGNITVYSGGSLIAKSSAPFNITYSRSLSTSNWYIFSAPASGQDIDDFVAATGLATGNGNNIALGVYDTTNNQWAYYQSGTSNSDILTSATGYAVNLSGASGALSIAGGMPTDDSFSLSLNTTGSRFNLLGNPYPSFLNLSDVLTNSSSALETQTVWVWDQSANAGNGTYITKVTVDNFQLAPGQGFLVQADADGGNFIMSENEQSHQGTDTFTRNSWSQKPEIHLSLTDGTNEMQTKLYYIEGTTMGFDNGFDGEVFKGAGSGGFNIYTSFVTNSQGESLAIQSLPPDNYENMVIPIGINAEAGSQINFSTAILNLPEEINVYLEDTKTKTFTKLNEEGSSYQTSLLGNHNGTGRFYLHTTSQTLNSRGLIPLEHVNIYTTEANNLRVQGIKTGKAQIHLYDLVGKRVLDTSFEGRGTNDISLPHLKAGVYIVKLQTELGEKDQKIIIE